MNDQPLCERYGLPPGGGGIAVTPRVSRKTFLPDVRLLAELPVTDEAHPHPAGQQGIRGRALRAGDRGERVDLAARRRTCGRSPACSANSSRSCGESRTILRWAPGVERCAELVAELDVVELPAVPRDEARGARSCRSRPCRSWPRSPGPPATWSAACSGSRPTSAKTFLLYQSIASGSQSTGMPY